MARFKKNLKELRKEWRHQGKSERTRTERETFRSWTKTVRNYRSNPRNRWSQNKCRTWKKLMLTLTSWDKTWTIGGTKLPHPRMLRSQHLPRSKCRSLNWDVCIHSYPNSVLKLSAQFFNAVVLSSLNKTKSSTRRRMKTWSSTWSSLAALSFSIRITESFIQRLTIVARTPLQTRSLDKFKKEKMQTQSR